MSRIGCGEVCPRSKTFFQTRECAVWLLWGISAIVGAFAVAVTLFVLNYRQYGLYEATHDNFFTFMVEALPLIWIVVFGLMILVSVYELRSTKRGYRYPLWQILLSSVVVSLAGGAALQLVGFGYTTDHMLGEHMGMYNSQDKLERKMWQNPEDGRMLGKQVHPLLPPNKTIDFVDVDGRDWLVDVTELTEAELELLGTKESVRLIGALSEENEDIFHSCGVFPWQLEKQVSREDLSAARKAFETKVHGYGEQAEHAMLKVSGKEDDDIDDVESPCSETPIMKRFNKSKYD